MIVCWRGDMGERYVSGLHMALGVTRIWRIKYILLYGFEHYVRYFSSIGYSFAASKMFSFVCPKICHQ